MTTGREHDLRCEGVNAIKSKTKITWLGRNKALTKPENVPEKARPDLTWTVHEPNAMDQHRPRDTRTI